ncbi:MAG: hypothetical protein KDK66_07485 [Deltaproteobacteria bacterium]|nr:hypothetical protein [Deltaproteobacteria bacterium]
MNKEKLIKERVPVWEALSELFLDQDLSEQDYQAVASKLAASVYSLSQLKEILQKEVYPACKSNLKNPAGEWRGFSQDWIRQHIAPRLDKKGCLDFLRGWGTFDKKQWKEIESRIKVIRSLKD